MTRASWDETWMGVAHQVARRSGCVRAQVGAAVVDPTNRIVASGYNGPPAGLALTCETGCPRARFGPSHPPGVYDDCLAIHAEANALMFGDRRERDGGTIYVTDVPCLTCAKLVANSGLARVAFPHAATPGAHRDHFASEEILRASGLDVVRVG